MTPLPSCRQFKRLTDTKVTKVNLLILLHTFLTDYPVAKQLFMLATVAMVTV